MGLRFELKILLFFCLYLNSVLGREVPKLSSNSERRALLELRASLGIRAKDWPRKVNPCLNWTGIVCRRNHVTGINLSGLRRSHFGKLNPRFAVESLPSFAFLTHFNSSGFSLPGSIPEWLGQRLSNLQVLDLSSCSIRGSIPSSIGHLRKLNVLHLSDNSITGIIPAALGMLFSLSILDLSKNLLTGSIPSDISALGNLTSLDLSSNYLSGPIPSDLGSLSSLNLLNLSNNSLSGYIPPQLGKLSRLTELDLGYNSLLRSLPDSLARLRSIRRLLIGNNELEGPLSDDLFRDLIQLEYLVLSGNNFDGRVPDVIWSNSHLRYLDLSGNNLTGAIPNSIHASNSSGVVFNLSYNLFYGNLSFGVEKFESIDLSNNYFQGLAPISTRSHVIVTKNCFRNVAGQRNGNDCRKFYSDRGLILDHDIVNQPNESPRLKPRKTKKELTYSIIGVFGGLGLVIILAAGFLLLMKTCNIGSNRSVKSAPGADTKRPPNAPENLSGLRESFSYEQMLRATNNFSDEYLIKCGHSGFLFRGILEDSHPVVVKKIDLHLYSKEAHTSELDLFSKVTHPRLVPLLGHCSGNEHEKMLVYKYMPNGDLSSSLHRLGDSRDDGIQSLDWITRLKIAIGAAEALCYLHHECDPPLVHRDVQASSILLDDKYEVRLGSLSEVCPQGADSNNNMISRFLRTSQSSGKGLSGSLTTTCGYDVYCFGKVLLELVTGKLGISSSDDASTKQWLESNLPFISIYEKEPVVKIVDQSLMIDEDLLEEVWAVAIVAKSCLNPRPSKRPLMRHVLRALENPFKVVREESFSSGRLRTSSSRRSWAAALFGSWRQSSSESANTQGQTNREIIGGLRQSGRVGSRSSGGNDYSSSHKRSSSEIFPEPAEMQDIERQDG